MSIRLAIYRGSIDAKNRIAFEKVPTIEAGKAKAESLMDKVQGKFDGYVQVVSDRTGYVHEEYQSFKFNKESS